MYILYVYTFSGLIHIAIYWVIYSKIIFSVRTIVCTHKKGKKGAEQCSELFKMHRKIVLVILII